MRSACLGVARNAPAPKRSRSNREAPTAIISIAQHASPNVIGQMEFLRPQLMKKSRLVTMMPSSNRFSIQLMRDAPFVGCRRDIMAATAPDLKGTGPLPVGLLEDSVPAAI